MSQTSPRWTRAAALVPLFAAPMAAIGLWEVLVLLRPDYAAMHDPYQPELYRLALGLSKPWQGAAAFVVRASVAETWIRPPVGAASPKQAG